ncbi:MAG: cytochrome c peroxidase [Burkholderiaceae bacterium]
MIRFALFPGIPARLCFAALLALAGNSALSQIVEPLAALPERPALDPAAVALGARLFADRRFGRDDSLACASCHDLARGGADSRPGSEVFSAAVGTARHIFNTPTVYNAALNYRQQWTGGARSLEDLVDKVVNSPLVFDSNWQATLTKLAADPALVAEFQRVYPQRGLSQETVQESLATFQRSLLTPSRFDRYLRGEANAISDDEKHGYDRFKAYGCVGCHQGVNVGGNMMQRFGAMNDYFADRAKAGLPAGEGDAGRFRVTKRQEDLHVFKVPSLRNVALTAPYFHNGSAATLDEAVDVMFRYQLGRAAPAQDKALIVKFLHSLTGEQFEPR